MRDGTMTSEGVVIDARPASFLTRALGAALDITVALVLLGLIAYATSRWTPADLLLDYGAPIGIATFVAVLVGLPCAVETVTRGRSLGKLATGVRVVRDDGGPVRLRHAFIRSLVGVGEIWLTFGCVALIVSLSNDRGRRLGDMLAGTYVVRIRGGSQELAPLVSPPWLTSWARHADMRRLPDGLALDARRFLGRAGKLNPGSRARLGLEIATRLEQHVAPGPPPGTPVEDFIAAVLAERRDREHVRETSTQRRVEESAAVVRRLPHGVGDPSR
ncbi:RDD family protein [Paraoerskovia sediminicola]|uniref:RDD family protein n=1 Tax=Paraoerskovia sediminicola TaxID=1138587 RepID=A0ABM8G4E1_9CELL|nr:RDD family protein [Paraoerskovia sediminicola]BDZ42895.1 RDD family protein [Paraoerskovia sediminicola]